MYSLPFRLGTLVLFLSATFANAECTCTEDVDPSQAFYHDFVDATNTRTIQTNGIPSHEYHIGRDRINPHSVCMQPSQVELPVSPVFDDYKDSPMGVIGILKTGGFVYNHKSSTDGSNDVANHPNNEQPGLDICHGHADAKCTYHYHEISQLQECTHDGQWDTCELIGYILDGFPLYSHCFYAEKNRYLQSCYSITNDVDQDDGGDTSDYSHAASDGCDLDAANGFDFTGKGIFDSEGNEINGYAYVASDAYPYVMPKYVGSTWNRLSTLDVAFTSTPSSTPSFEPTLAPSLEHSTTIPSFEPTLSPSSEESFDPTPVLPAPSSVPSFEPTLAPSTKESLVPTPTSPPVPTFRPTVLHSTPNPSRLTNQPTPTQSSNSNQTPEPTTTRRASKLPTRKPTQQPTNIVQGPTTASPTLPADQTPKPTTTRRPTKLPTSKPTQQPTNIVQGPTTASPTLPADQTPKPTTTRRPTKLPTSKPTQQPTNIVQGPTTASPTLPADQTPKPTTTRRPTKLPTSAPTQFPVSFPTPAPSVSSTSIAQDPSTSSPTISGDSTPRPTTKRTTSRPTKAPKKQKSEKKRPKLPKSTSTRAPTPERISFQPSIAPSAQSVSVFSGLLASVGGVAASLLTCGMGS